MNLRKLTSLSVTASLIGFTLTFVLVINTWNNLSADIEEINRLADIQSQATELNVAANHLILTYSHSAIIDGIRDQVNQLLNQLDRINHYATRPARQHLLEMEQLLLSISEMNRDTPLSQPDLRPLNMVAAQVSIHESGMTAALKTILADRHASLDRSLQSSLMTLIFLAVLVAAFSLLGFTLLHRRISGPVQVLQGTIHRHQSGDTDARVPDLGRHELGQLGESFNQLADDHQRHEAELSAYQAELESSLKKLETLAYQDPLTGGLSREGFVEELRRMRSTYHANHGYLAAFNLVGMRDINETHGYAHGDHLLRAICQRAEGWLNESGRVARVGGDEFVLYQPVGSSSVEAADLVNDLLEIIEPPYRLGEVLTQAEVNIGIVEAGDDPETDLRRAEIALFSVRRSGTRQWQAFTPELEHETHERLRLTESLRTALHNDEFLLHYQPQVDLETGQLTGGEALIRWDHPSFGLQSPGQFIPVAEQSKLIIPIGEWALREACRQIAEWREEGLPGIKLAVNVSLVQFLTSDFDQTVRRILEETATAASDLSLEITESIFDQRSEQLSGQINRLHDLGVRLSLDDFGTGYSSLRYIREYPFSTIKLDRSFVSRIADDPYSRSICEMVIRIGNELGADVIAEGIETEDQRRLLIGLGCRTGQGFLFRRPATAASFRELLTSDTTLASPLD